jgi:hypothetical protein
MANVNLVKSIYTSTVVTSLGELAAADTAEIPGNAQIDGLTASQAVLTDTSKKLVSMDYLNQAVKTTSSPTFAGLTLSGLTPGSVLFAGTGRVISQDNSYLFWDDTNQKMQIKNNLGSTPIEVIADSSSSQPAQIAIKGCSNSSQQLLFGYNTTENYGYIQAMFFGINAESLILNPDGGFVGIATRSPSEVLDVIGNIKGQKIIGTGDVNSSFPSQITIKGASDSNQQIMIGYNTTSNYGAIQAYYFGVNVIPLCLNINGGNVGIGKIPVTDLLEIAGNIRTYSNIAWDLGAVTVGAVVLDSSNYVAVTIGGVAYKLLKAV